MPASDMTIVHLSEFHLQAVDKEPTGIPYEDLLDGYGDALRTLEHLREYVSKPDLFVVTGDLVLGARNSEVGYPRVPELLQQFEAEFHGSCWPWETGMPPSRSGASSSARPGPISTSDTTTATSSKD